MRPPAGQTGMTLVEMLIVLAIIGVATGATVLGMGAMGGASAETEARRLGARLRAAADETMVTERPLALTWDAESYGFVTPDARGRWTPAVGGGLEPHELPSGIRLTGPRGSAPLPILVDGAAAPIQLGVTGSSGSWRVAFDGFDVAIAPVAAR